MSCDPRSRPWSTRTQNRNMKKIHQDYQFDRKNMSKDVNCARERIVEMIKRMRNVARMEKKAGCRTGAPCRWNNQTWTLIINFEKKQLKMYTCWNANLVENYPAAMTAVIHRWTLCGYLGAPLPSTRPNLPRLWPLARWQGWKHRGKDKVQTTFISHLHINLLACIT